VEKSSPKKSASSVIFKKVPKVINGTMGENCPNLFTLVAGRTPMSVDLIDEVDDMSVDRISLDELTPKRTQTKWRTLYLHTYMYVTAMCGNACRRIYGKHKLTIGCSSRALHCAVGIEILGVTLEEACLKKGRNFSG
jgi:hypothetical protein